MNRGLNWQNETAYLNGIKGLACLPVFLGHFKSDFTCLPGLEGILNISCFKTILINGNWALNIFFLISAFLIANDIMTSDGFDNKWICKKMVKRYFRLAIPLFVLYECIYFVQKLGLFANLETAKILGTEKYLGTYFTTDYTQLGAFKEAFIGTLFNSEFTFNSVMWMMTIMFMGYFIAILLSLFIKWGGKSCGWITLALLVVLLVINSHYSLFVAGVLLAVFKSEYMEKLNYKWIRTYGIVAIILGCFFANYCYGIASRMANWSEDFVFASWYLYSKIGAILFMIGVVCFVGIQKVFTFKPFRWLNKVSFPIFMFHRVIEASVGSLAFLWIYDRTGSEANGIRLAFVSTIIAMIIVAILYAYLIEPQINKLTVKIVNFIMREK